MEATSLQMVGRETEAINMVYDALEKERRSSLTFRLRLHEALGYVFWMAGDLPRLCDTGEALMRLGKKEGLPDCLATGRYFMGMATYFMGRLEEAREVLSEVFTSDYQPYSNFLIRATHILAMTYESLAQPERARKLLEDTVSYCLDTANSYSLAMVRGFQAELALRQGRLADAENWLTGFKPSPTPMSYGPAVAELAAAKVVYRRNTPEALEEAGQQVATLKKYFEKIHNTRYFIEALALEALVHQAAGEMSLAVASLEQAMALAQPRGSFQLFVDLGPEMAKLLNRLELDEEGLAYVGRILAAIKKKGEGDRWPLPVDTLSKREREILGLLGEQLSNKEISERLFISPVTVKRHAATIYQKLAVHGRREAVAKAQGLGILGAEV